MLAARSNYLALDRPDIQYATKELCRGFATPTRRDHVRLKRLVRYPLGRPRLIWKYPWQDCHNEHLIIDSDTDFAGCNVTRRSTSGVPAMRGVHLIKAYSQTQTTVRLSSAEAGL